MHNIIASGGNCRVTQDTIRYAITTISQYSDSAIIDIIDIARQLHNDTSQYLFN